jgi:ketosteroid isomerase-like protein
MSLEELERRVRAMEDLEAIKRMHRQYMNHLDNLEFGAAAAMFAEDATAQVRTFGVKHGKKEIEEVYMGILAHRKERFDAHLVSQPIVTLDGDWAKGEWIVYMFFSKPTLQWVQGRHECEYVKVDGQWKFSYLKFTRTLSSDPLEYP